MWPHSITREAGKCSQTVWNESKRFSEQVASLWRISNFHLPEILKELEKLGINCEGDPKL